MSSEALLLKFFKNSSIPNRNKSPLTYVLKDLSLTKGLNKVWIEFGTTNSTNIEAVAAETSSTVYSINNFGGMYSKATKLLDTKKRRNIQEVDIIPTTSSHVKILKGTYMSILPGFLKKEIGKSDKITLMLIAPGLYSSTKYILDATKTYMDAAGCYVVFEKLLNFPHGDVYSELKDYRQKRTLPCGVGKKYLRPRGDAAALRDFINQNTGPAKAGVTRKKFTWIGMNGAVGTSHYDGRSEMAAIKIEDK